MAERAPINIENTKAEINTEIERAAIKIRDAVSALVDNLMSDPITRRQIPPLIDAERYGGEPSSGGGLFEEYPAFDVRSSQLVMVTEEYFEFSQREPVIHGRDPLPIEDWLKYGPKIIEQIEYCVKTPAETN